MKKIQFLLLIVLFSCSSLNKTTDEVSDKNITISYKQSINNIDFKVQNLNKQNIYYVKKNTLDIERHEDGNWLRVKILPCPCDAPCRELNNEIVIKPNEIIDIKWNMIESWCGKSNGTDFVRETITKKVDKGRYRIKFTLKHEDGSIFQLIKEFNIN